MNIVIMWGDKMSVKVTIGVYTGEKAVLDKWNSTTQKTTYTGTIRGEINAVSPVVTVQDTILPFFNYAKIELVDGETVNEYGYYYISNIVNDRTDLTEIVLSRDALETFSSGIKASPCIARRTTDAGKFTTFIPDNFLKRNAYTTQQQIAPATTNIFSYNGKLILLTTG